MANLIFVFTLIVFSFSSAQNMFFHLLPGFGTPFTWVGLGGDANWTTPANWNTSAVPGASDVAIFDNSCITNCNPTINASISVRGLDIKATYSGTITQAAGQSITIGSAGWVQAGGTFTGSDSNITFNASILNLSNAANFTSTSGETYFDLTNGASLDVVTVPASSSLVFPNNSTQRFRLQGNCGNIQYGIVSPQKISFYNLITTAHAIGCGSPRFNAPAGGVEIRNNYTHTGDSMGAVGNFDLYGNMTLASGIDIDSTWNAIGSVSKVFSGPGAAGRLIVNKTGGASFSPIDGSQTFGARAFELISGEFTFPQTFAMFWTSSSSSVHFRINPGTIANVPTNSTVTIETWGACGGITKGFDVDGLFNFENLSLIGNYTGCGQASMDLAAGDALVVKKNFSLGHSFAADFNISVEGNYSTVGSPNGSMAVSLVNGMAASWSQAQVGTVNGLVTVTKPGLTTTAATNISLTNSGQSLNISNGTVNLSGRNLDVNNVISIGTNGKLICNGGTASAFSWTVQGEVSCGNTVGVTWTGLAGDNLWSTPGNWTNNTVPGPSDVAIFNGICTGLNCNVQTDSNLSLRGITILSGYSGTFTMMPGHSLLVGSAGFSQGGGTFFGGDSTFTNRGSFSMTGGTYTATSSSWIQNLSLTIVGTSVFNHGSGSLILAPEGGGGASVVVNATPATFNHVSIGGPYFAVDLATSTLQVDGTLTLTDTIGGLQPINNGSISARGDIQLSNAGKFGSAVINIVGTGSQTLTGIATSFIPSVSINKPSGTLTLVGTINSAGNWSHLAGTVASGTSTLIFTYVNGTGVEHVITPGSMIYNEVVIQGSYVGINLSSGTMNIQGNLTLADSLGASSRLNNGTLQVAGDITLTNEGKWGTAIIVINGTGNQSLTGVATAYIPTVQINKTSGTLTLVGTIRSSGSWAHILGTVNAGTSNLVITHGSSSGIVHTITPGSVIYNDVTFQGSYVGVTLTGDMTVQGNLVLSDSIGSGSAMNGNRILARGNITASNDGKFGTTSIVIDGTGNQTLTGVGGAHISNVQINKPSGILSLVGTIQSSGNWSHLSGNVDAGNSTLILSYYTFGMGLSVRPGSVEYHNVMIQGSAIDFNFNAETMKVNGTLTFNGPNGSEGNISNGTLEAYGSVTVTNGGKGGTASLRFVGPVSSNFSYPAGYLLSTTVEIAKTGGSSVVLQTNVNFSSAGRDLTLTSGTLDLNTYDFSVNDTLTVGAAGTLRCNGGEFTSGTLVNNGTVNCPGFSNYEFNFTNANGNSDWNDPLNWQGGGVPSAQVVAAFADAYCNSGPGCSVQTSGAISVRGVRIYSPFTGSITQNNGHTINVGVRGWTQAAGTFSGGNSNVWLDGPFQFTAGNYTATTATTFMGHNWTMSGGIFNSNNGTFQTNNIGVRTIASGTARFNNFTFTSTNACVGWTLSAPLQVDGNLVLDTDNWCGPVSAINGSQVNVQGNVLGFRYGATGTTNLRLVGNPSGQTLSAVGSNVRIPATQIVAGIHDVSVSGDIRIDGNWNLTSVGNFIANGSTLRFSTSNSIIPGSVNYGNVTFPTEFACLTHNLSGASMNISGDLLLQGDMWCGSPPSINNGTFLVSGNVAVSNSGHAGTASITMTGSGNTSFSQSGSSVIPSGNVTISKTGGAKVSLLSNARFNSNGSQSLIVTSTSELDLSGFNLTVGGNIQNLGVLSRGINPACGTISQGGSFSGNAAICP